MAATKIWEDAPEYPITADRLSRTINVIPGAKDHFLEANDAGNGVVIKAGTKIGIQGSSGLWRVFEFETDTEVTDLDTGALTLGTDYFVYLTDTGDVIISANSTAPVGYTTENTRKIGGFHYGRVRPLENRYDITATLPVKVIPNSVWDLVNRPKCPDPTGMVKVGHIWVDIYLCSVEGTWPSAKAVSRYNATPVSGSEGYCYMDYFRLAKNAGKRLPTWQEFLMFAYGHPSPGDNTFNARQLTGSIHWAVSCENVDQCAGNLWQVLDETFLHCDGGTWGWKDILNTGKDQTFNHGQAYTANGFHVLLAGGIWGAGGRAGARCAYLYCSVGNVCSSVGFRCVSDPL